MKTYSVISALCLAAVTAGCGGGGSEPQDPSVQSTDLKVNPLAKSKLPTQSVDLHTSVPTDGLDLDLPTGLTIDGVISLNPSGKTVKFVVSILNYKVTLSGVYEPTTGLISFEKCNSNVPGACADFTPASDIASLKDLNFVGDGRVLLSTDFPFYLGVSPTSASNMPNGKITYTGDFVGLLSTDDDDSGNQISGTATTTANFATDVLSVHFADLSGDAAGNTATLSGANIDGNKFTGGQLVITTVDGSKIRGGDTSVSGQFFGDDAAEVGGSLVYVNENAGVSLGGAWNGVKQ